MARLTLCFVLLAAALGNAIQPSAPPNPSVVSPDVANLKAQIAAANEQLPVVVTKSPNNIVLGSAGDAGTCYKIRAFIFKRDDDHAPQFVRSTTCGPGQPRTKNADWPKARLVPAD